MGGLRPPVLWTNMIELFENYFWLVATQSVVLIVPIIGIKILFNIIGDLLFKEK